jgi:CRP/FNR family transcriptional regulator, dissimilatory nitrate respiration regulator
VMKNLLSFLDDVPLFKGLPAEQLKALTGIAIAKSVKKGEKVFAEGETALGFYVVVRGRIKIFKVSPDGKEQVLHIVSFPEPFGEVPVFAGVFFPANAHVIEDASLVFFPRNAFVDLIKKDPSLAMNMMALLSKRLMQFTSLIENLALKEVPSRLAAYLLYLSERNSDSNIVELDIPKALLSNVLGTIPETVSRVFSKMTAEGIINVKGRKIHLLDKKRISEVSSGLAALASK